MHPKQQAGMPRAAALSPSCAPPQHGLLKKKEKSFGLDAPRVPLVDELRNGVIKTWAMAQYLDMFRFNQGNMLTSCRSCHSIDNVLLTHPTRTSESKVNTLELWLQLHPWCTQGDLGNRLVKAKWLGPR